MYERQSNMQYEIVLKHDILLKHETLRSTNINQGEQDMEQQEMEYLNINNENIEIV